MTPTLSHISIQLMLKNSDYIYIIEYGQYFSKDTEIKSNFFSSSSSNEPRESTNDHDYYYINKDGARITRLSKNKILEELEMNPFTALASYCIDENFQKSLNVNVNEEVYGFLNQKITELVAKGFYGEIKDINDFKRVECDVKNKITLKELCNNFKNEKWVAKKYNVVSHNCQTFAAEIIKLLKVIRINEVDKIRTNEKFLLPGCIIKELWNNEDLSFNNTMGRIPIV